MMRTKHIPPIPVKAGDLRVKINGNPPRVDCRIIAEVEYQLLLKAFNVAPELLEACQIIAGLKGFEPDEYYGKLLTNAIKKATT